MSILDPLSNAWELSQQQFDKAVADLKTKARDFAALKKQLESRENIVRQSNPELIREYSDVMSSSITVQNTVENVTGAIDWTTGKISDIFGTEPNDVNTLGALPALGLVGYGSMIAAIGLMGAWITKARSLSRKIDLAERILNEGGTPSQAASLFGTDNDWIKWAIGAGALYFLWPSVKGLIGGR